jgi:purine-nucleoside phosphorylase
VTTTSRSGRDCFGRVEEAANAIRGRVGAAPTIGVVLGSGLGAFASSLAEPITMSYDDLPHWPTPGVAGHEGRATVGTMRGRLIASLAGRCHYYEGRGIESVTFGVRVLALLGVRVVILTNAAGGIRAGLDAGDLMVIDDHINLMGINPLMGPHDRRFGVRFPDMSEVYSARLRVAADRAGQARGVALKHGVYAAVAGPSYETPAEIRYLRAIGVDAVGMSTVPEAIVARHMGVEVLGLSCISNPAAGLSPRPLDHERVVATASRAVATLTSVLEEVVGQL